jgi:hypothetical protein
VTGKCRRRFLRATAGTVAAAAAAWLVAAACGGCASPVEGLWPPEPGAASHRITVSVDDWHSVIGIWPEGDSRGAEPSDLREWGYAERAYYHEGSMGSCGSLRAMLWPTEGVVVVHDEGRPMEEWSPDPPVRSWTFELTPEGHRALRAHLEGTLGSDTPFAEERGALWYEADRSYHAFHHCHHWTADALRAAGLPVTSFWAPFKWSLESQLDRAADMAAEIAGGR